MHKDDGNMLKKFQQIPVHTFREIDHHHLQPFSIFIEIRASIGQVFFYGEMHKDDSNMLKKPGESNLPFKRYGLNKFSIGLF